jgi:anti-sigma factor RsiW
MNNPTCINPSEIEEGDLMAYLYGDASRQVIEHIAHCARCADRVEQLRLIDAQLLADFYRDACPTPDVLADFVLNRLPAAEKLRVAAHVRGCAICTEEVAAVRDLADEGPPTLLARLWESLAQALVARPVVPVAVPSRGVGLQGRFEVDDLVVTLSVQAGILTGRVRRREALPEADRSGQAWLLNEGMTVGEDVPCSEVDARGRFRFTAPPVGSYSLLLQTGGQNVALEGIRIT